MADKDFDGLYIPLRQKIIEIEGVIKNLMCDYHSTYEDTGAEKKIEELCCQIYHVGFNDGRTDFRRTLYRMRLIDDPEKPGKQKAVFPGDPDYPKPEGFTIISN